MTHKQNKQVGHDKRGLSEILHGELNHRGHPFFRLDARARIIDKRRL